MNANDKLNFKKFEKEIQRNQVYALGFIVFLMTMEGFGELQTLKYFFLNAAGIFALGAFLVGFVGSLVLQSKGMKLKHAQIARVYQFLFLFMSGVLFIHYYLVIKGFLPF